MNYYDPPLEYEKLPIHLRSDVVHKWRALNGIELIHKEPTLEELNRIWNNWKLMPSDLKDISDEKSFEVFGMDNETHYCSLLSNYLEDSSEELLESLNNLEKIISSKRLQESIEKRIDKFLRLLEDFFEAEDGFLIEIKEKDSWKFISLDNSDKGYNTRNKAHIFKCKTIEAVRKLQIIKRLATNGFSEKNGNLRIESSKNPKRD